MGRKHAFMDRAFGRSGSDREDAGEFAQGLVFVIMSFTGSASSETYSVVKDECSKLGLQTRRADEKGGSDIFLVAREGTRLHFDIAPLRVQYYGSMEQLRKILGDQLRRMIRVTRDRRDHPEAGGDPR